MPTGGVNTTEESLRAWFEAGVSCVGIGSQLVTKELLKAGDYAGATAYLSQAEQAYADADDALGAPWALLARLVPAVAQNRATAVRVVHDAAELAGPIEHGPGERLAHPFAPSGLIGDDVLDPRPQPGGDAEHGQGGDADDGPLVVACDELADGPRRQHLVDLSEPQDFAALGRIFNEVSDRLLDGKPADADIR